MGKKVKPFNRSCLDPQAIHDNIQEVLYMLLVGYVPQYHEPPPGKALAVAATEEPPPALVWVPLQKEDISRLQVVLATQMKLLGKTLPDLKAIDWTDRSEKSTMTPEEVAQRIRGIAALQQLKDPKRVDGEAWMN
jgi:hypothetical protein